MCLVPCTHRLVHRHPARVHRRRYKRHISGPLCCTRMPLALLADCALPSSHVVPPQSLRALDTYRVRALKRHRLHAPRRLTADGTHVRSSRLCHARSSRRNRASNAPPPVHLQYARRHHSLTLHIVRTRQLCNHMQLPASIDTRQLLHPVSPPENVNPLIHPDTRIQTRPMLSTVQPVCPSRLQTARRTRRRRRRRYHRLPTYRRRKKMTMYYLLYTSIRKIYNRRIHCRRNQASSRISNTVENHPHPTPPYRSPRRLALTLVYPINRRLPRRRFK